MVKKRNNKKPSKKNDSLSVKEVKRHMSALSENFQDKVSVLAEGMVGVHKKLDSHSKMIGSLMTDMSGVKSRLDIIQSDVEIIKDNLKQKVDRNEFKALVRRVSVLERKTIK